MPPQQNPIPKSAINAINRLGWDMIRKLCEDGTPVDGTTISSLSIGIALAMLAGGADEEESAQLCEKLGLRDLTHLKTAFSSIQSTLASASSGGRSFTSANALFADKTTTVFPGYAEFLQSFSAHIDAEFPVLSEGTDQINGWVSSKTNGMISKLLRDGDLLRSNMVLINAVYFKAPWKEKFKKTNTIKNFPFHARPHQQKPVNMMFFYGQSHQLLYGPNYTAVLLPYVSSPSDESCWSFIAYLPLEDATMDDVLSTIRKEGIPDSFKSTKLSKLGLPKFNLKNSQSISPLLSSLGFPMSGDFPGMGKGIEMVDSMIHSVRILLDENGTKAAAATAIVLKPRKRARTPPSLVFDRPFVFSIVEEDMGLVLFSGVFSVDKKPGKEGDEKLYEKSDEDSEW